MGGGASADQTQTLEGASEEKEPKCGAQNASSYEHVGTVFKHPLCFSEGRPKKDVHRRRERLVSVYGPSGFTAVRQSVRRAWQRAGAKAKRLACIDR